MYSVLFGVAYIRSCRDFQIITRPCELWILFGLSYFSTVSLWYFSLKESPWHSEDSKPAGTLSHFLSLNQKALEVSCHFSLECFLSKNRKGSSVSHTLVEVRYQCRFTVRDHRCSAQSRSCGVIVRLSEALCCTITTKLMMPVCLQHYSLVLLVNDFSHWL